MSISKTLLIQSIKRAGKITQTQIDMIEQEGDRFWNDYLDENAVEEQETDEQKTKEFYKQIKKQFTSTKGINILKHVLAKYKLANMLFQQKFPDNKLKRKIKIKKWTITEINRLQRLLINGRTNKEIAKKLKRSYDSIRGARRRYF